MTIGEALKSIRLEHGLTQKEMVAGFTTESFYSKVEHNIHKIDAEVLLNILVANHIDLEDFFDKILSQDSKKNPYFELESQLKFVQNIKDITKLDKLAENLKNKNNIPEVFKVRLEESYAWIFHSNAHASIQLKKKVRRQLTKCEWNKFSYTFLSHAIILLDIDDAYKLVDSAFKAYERDPQTDVYTLQAISQICINFLNCCYHQKAKRKYIYRASIMLKSLPANLAIGLEKIIGEYYTALLKNNKQQQKEIVKLLKLVGYYQLIEDTVEE
ncbi:helix-turn-helix domain-containing protein [Lactobacillus sp. PSON]|uniref:helix-turn-helix domain-containing protein n=1 Tax=Lactobacillus sp. PSON TaxID=3455454 RepID=UPI0040414DB0